jgi:hypothetical protein
MAIVQSYMFRQEENKVFDPIDGSKKSERKMHSEEDFLLATEPDEKSAESNSVVSDFAGAEKPRV